MLQRVSYWILAMLPMLAMDIATIVCLSLMHFHSIGGMSNQKQSCVFFLYPHASHYAEVTHLHCPKQKGPKILHENNKKPSPRWSCHVISYGRSSGTSGTSGTIPGGPGSPASTILLMYCTYEDRSVSGQCFFGFFSTFFTWLNPKTP